MTRDQEYGKKVTEETVLERTKRRGQMKVTSNRKRNRPCKRGYVNKFEFRIGEKIGKREREPLE